MSINIANSSARRTMDATTQTSFTGKPDVHSTAQAMKDTGAEMDEDTDFGDLDLQSILGDVMDENDSAHGDSETTDNNKDDKSCTCAPSTLPASTARVGRKIPRTGSQAFNRLPQFVREDTHEDYRRFPEDFLPCPLTDDMYPDAPVFSSRDAVHADTVAIPSISKTEMRLMSQQARKDGSAARTMNVFQGEAQVSSQKTSPSRNILQESVDGAANIKTSSSISPRGLHIPDPDSVLLFRELEDGSLHCQNKANIAPRVASPGHGSEVATELASSYHSSVPMSDVSSRANDSNGYLARDDRRISVQGDNNDERMSTLLSELIQLMERKVDTDEEGLRYLKLVVEGKLQNPGPISPDFHAPRHDSRRRRDHDYHKSSGHASPNQSYYNSRRRDNSRDSLWETFCDDHHEEYHKNRCDDYREDRYNRRDRYERPSSYHSDLDNCHEDYEGRRYSGRYD